MISGTVWAYRGSASSRCSHIIMQYIGGDYDDIENIKKAIEKANNDKNYPECNYDYAKHGSEIIVYCKTHGSGANKAMLDNISSDRYYGNRFNHTAFSCAKVLIIICFVLGIIRFFYHIVLKNKK